jgi:excisionase family DNA binding protein
MPNQTFTIPQAAVLACVSTKTLRRRISDGDLKAIRLGPRLIRISSDALDAFLAGRKMA